MQSLQDLWTAAVPEQVPHSLEYPAGTMVDEFDRATAEFADLPALDFFGRQTSYAELREAAYTVAANLAARGVGPGTQVALLMPTCPQHVIAFYGVLLAGGTVVEHNPLATVSELTPMFADHLADVAIGAGVVLYALGAWRLHAASRARDTDDSVESAEAELPTSSPVTTRAETTDS